MIIWMLLVLLAARVHLSASPDEAPLSATDPFYLSCKTSPQSGRVEPGSRSAKTPILKSNKGLSAYAEVQVTGRELECENTITLFVSRRDDTKFRVVYRKTPKENDGNGIRLLGWSPSGDKLLAEVNQWRYFSDIGFETVPLVYDSQTESVTEVADLDKAVLSYFGRACNFEHSVWRWKSNSQFIVRVSPAASSGEDEVHSCSEKPLRLTYDLEKKQILPLRRAR